tara:strand:+ start:223 stop:450 length:228 start_codon:yes stop_codon:yes gene_type:complete
MKSINEIKSKQASLTENDQIKTKEIARRVEAFSTNKVISSEGIKELYNIQTELHVFTEKYLNRVIYLLKQNHMVD